ncbi:MAG: hypothetical protein LLF76_09635 [Planctomycetaceae bacterium]|nr:hypothetical protein [Planctomycetaceae bacterium]
MMILIYFVAVMASAVTSAYVNGVEYLSWVGVQSAAATPTCSAVKILFLTTAATQVKFAAMKTVAIPLCVKAVSMVHAKYYTTHVP